MLLTEPNRITDVLYLEDERFNYNRDTVTIAIMTVAQVVGTVLGQITLGAVTSAVKASGANTGAGTLTVDVTTPKLANAKPGIYTVRVLAVGTFVVEDPKGIQVGEATYTAGGTTTFADQIKFAFVDDGSTHYVAGDGFDVTVAAGTGYWTPLVVAALDGSQNAAGVLLTPCPINTATQQAAIVDRGPALLKLNGLVWPAGIAGPQTTAAIAQLQLLGMVTRSDFGL